MKYLLGVAAAIGAVVIFVGLIIFFILVTYSVVFAHVHDRPDLDQWFQGLKSSGGMPCCANSDAAVLKDPDWKSDSGDCQITPIGMNNDKSSGYCVYFKDAWWLVPERALVLQPNKFGLALLWQTEDPGGLFIRCFMPGTGA
jgi:hypothetical protein